MAVPIPVSWTGQAIDELTNWRNEQIEDGSIPVCPLIGIQLGYFILSLASFIELTISTLIFGCASLIGSDECRIYCDKWAVSSTFSAGRSFYKIFANVLYPYRMSVSENDFYRIITFPIFVFSREGII